MTFITFPPYFFHGAGFYFIRGKCAVFGRVPLFGNFRGNDRKIVFFADYFIIAVRATAAIISIIDNHLPFMPFLAHPPYFLRGTGSNFVRRKVTVFCRVPLFGKFRPDGF